MTKVEYTKPELKKLGAIAVETLGKSGAYTDTQAGGVPTKPGSGGG